MSGDSLASHAAGWRRFLEEPARPRKISALPNAHWFAVATVCVGAFMGQLDASIVTLAFPTLKADFHTSIGAVQWVGLAYLLMLAVALPLVGRLADMMGRKLLYTYGFILFIAGSALCGLAPSLLALDAFRILQALGAAMLQANSVAIIANAMPPDELGRGIGVQGAAQALGLALGPMVGGLLIGLGGWRLIFFVNVPAGILGTILGWYLIPRSRNLTGQAHFDWSGSAVLLPAVGALFMALSLGASVGWSSPEIIGLFALAAAALVAFVLVESRTAAPILRLALLRVRSFSFGLAQALCTYTVLFGTLFVTPFFLEGTLRASPAATGIELLTMPAALGIIAPLAGRLADRAGPRLPIVSGMVVSGASLVALALLARDHVVFLAALVALGVGQGLAISPNNAATVGGVPREHTGVASGVLNMIRSLGTAMGLSVTASIFESIAGRAVNPTLVSAGFVESIWFLAGLSFFAAVLGVIRGNDLLSGDPTLRVE